MTAQELKNSILQLAIQGKLVKQDPNDEPASVLLEKIKEEREKLIKEKKIKKEKYSEIYKDKSDNHYYEKFEDGIVNDITEEIPFEIPSGWCWTRLKNIGNVIRGLTFSKSSKEQKDNTSLVLRGGNIDSKTEKLIFNDNIYVDSNIIKETQYIQKKDILIVASSGTKSSVGKSTYIDTDIENTSFGGFMMVIRLNEFINSKLISYNIKLLRQKIISETVGYISNITNPILNELLIAIPPQNEQNRIIEKIELLNIQIEKYDKHYSELELLNNTYKEELRKSILQYAIQGKLVSQNSNDESTEVLINKILEEKRELIKTKQIKKENLSVIYKDDTDNQFYEKFDDGTIINITDEIPFEIPSSWCWTKLRNIGVYKKGPFGSALTKNIFVPKSNNTIKVYEQKNAIQKDATLGDYYITREYYEKNMTGFEVQPKDIIVSCAGTIGETYIMPNSMEKGIINQALMRMRISEMFPQDYFLLYFDYVLKKSSAKKSSGSAIKNIPPFDIFKEFLVAVPPIKEQSKIIEKINVIFNIIETAE